MNGIQCSACEERRETVTPAMCTRLQESWHCCKKPSIPIVIVLRGGARGGLEEAIAPCRNMLAPRRKLKNYFVGDF